MTVRAATERDIAGGAPEVRPPEFVARDTELAQLAGTLARPPAVVLVEGEAGIGKSRLIREYLATQAGFRQGVLLAACPPFRQPCTLGPIVDAARQATDDIRALQLSNLCGALRPLFPEWADALPPAPESLADATAARHRLYRALAELLDGLQVSMLVIEDVHWADEATVEFLLFLVAQQPQRISLLVTWRTEDVPLGSLLRRLSSRLPTGTSWERITLGPMDVAATVEMVASMLPGGQVSAEFAKFLHAHTDGLPLAIEESVRLLRDRRDLRAQGSAWVRRRLDVLAVPPTVRDAVLERASRLSSAAVAVLRAASVLGEPAGEAVLTWVAGLARDEAQVGLSEVLGSGLVIESRSRGGQTMVFRHALAARAVYDGIPAPLRRNLHQRAGQSLQGATPLPLARLAHHFREAGDSGHWSRYAEQAADAARAAGDHTMTAALLHDLVVHAGRQPREVVRLACKVPLQALPGYASMADIGQSLRSVLDSAGLAAGQRAEARCLLGQILINTGDRAAGAAELELAMPGLTHRPVEAARAMVMLGWPLYGLWPAVEHRRWLDRAAAAVSDPAVSARDRRSILGDRTTALLMMGEEEGWAAVAGFPQEAADPREALSLAIDWMNAGEDATYWGRYGLARQSLTTALRLAVQHDYPRVRDLAQVWLAHLDWFTGAWDGLAGRAESLLVDLTNAEPPVLTEAMLTAGLLDAAAGATTSAEERLRVVLEGQTRWGIAGYSQEPAATLARLRLADGRIDEALALTEDSVNVIAAKGIWIWATDVVPVRVQALAASGDVGQAGKLVTAFAGGLGSRDAPAPQAALVTCQAILSRAHGQHHRAAALFGQAAAAWGQLPRPYEALLARDSQAACLLAGDDADAGLTLLAETHKKLSELGASGDAARVERMLRERGVRPPHSWRGGRRGYGNQLSPSELDVVRLVAVGWTSRKIGEALCRSPRTVDGQLNSAMRKLGVSSRAALAAAVVESGLVSGSESRLEPDDAATQ